MEENEFVFSLHSSHRSFFYSCLIPDLCLIYAWFILKTLMIQFPYFRTYMLTAYHLQILDLYFMYFTVVSL